MSAALERALQVLARMKGDSSVSMLNLKKEVDAALGRRRDADEDVEGQDDRLH